MHRMEVSGNAIKAYFILYAKSIYQDIPLCMYLSLLLITTVGFVLLFSNPRVKNKWRGFCRLVFFEYVVFTLCMTVFFRACTENIKFSLIPFWSYSAELADLQNSLYVENLMNVLMFIPFGLLIGCAYKDMVWKKMLFTAIYLSTSIEILQFLLRRGFAEVDDVIHNTLGAIIGFGLYKAMAYIVCHIRYCKRNESKEVR